MTFPSTVCTFECNLSLILCVIVLPCTLSFSSLFYRARCPFPPCSTVHFVLFLLVLPYTLPFSSLVYRASCPFPPCSTMHFVLFLVGLPCKISLSSRWFNPDPCHFPQVSSHLLSLFLLIRDMGQEPLGLFFRGTSAAFKNDLLRVQPLASKTTLWGVARNAGW